VSPQALAGLACFNVFLLAVGASILWAARGWTSWAELARLSGLAYMTGVAMLGIVFVLELVCGLPLRLEEIVGSGVAVFLVGLVTAHRLGRRLPPLHGLSRPRGAMTTVTAVSGALVVVYFEALFRAGRLRGLYEWDAWAFWVPKAKAIYYFGGLDEAIFGHLPGPTYPPLVPAIESSAFHFMGSPDVVTLHLQFSIFLLGFVAAIVGLLAPRVSPLFLWPIVLLVLLAPRVYDRALDPQADFLLDYFWALAVLLIAFWLFDRQPWQLVLATLFLGAAMLTKREGYLLTACVVAASLLASRREWRSTWPRLAIASACAVALTVPWRIWFGTRHLAGEGTEAGGLGLLSHVDRLRPSLELTISSFFDDERWLLIAPVVAGALLVAWLAGARRVAAYATLVYVLALTGFAWIVWSFPSMPITKNEAVNPIVRVEGSLIIASIALVPLLLQAAWRRSERFERDAGER
jgi:hypothetical protein